MNHKLHSLLCSGLRRMSRRLCRRNNDVTPESVIRSIPERSMDPAVAPHIGKIKVIRHAGAESYVFETEMPLPFRTEMHFARRHVYRLRNVAVNVRTGACAAQTNYFQESFGSLRRCLLERPFPSARGGSLHVKGPATCVHVTGYYHFLCEEVPRLLWTIKCVPETAIFLYRDAPPFVYEILAELHRRSVIGASVQPLDVDIITVDDYDFTQAEAYSGFIHSSDLAILRESLLGHSDTTGNFRPRIYLSRRYAARAFDNEADVEAFMVGRGFTIYRPDQLSFVEQLSLFRQAEVVVAPHGAGLANLVWCRPGRRVIELFSSRHFNDCYARICSQLEHHYEPLWAKESAGWGLVSLEELSEQLVSL